MTCNKNYRAATAPVAAENSQVLVAAIRDSFPSEAEGGCVAPAADEVIRATHPQLDETNPLVDKMRC